MCEAAEKIYYHGIEEGIEQGIEQGETAQKKKTAIRLYKKGEDIFVIADILDSDTEQVRQWVNAAALH